jgi:hypothetical protein
MYIEAGFGDMALQARGQGTTGASAAQMIGYVDAAIAKGAWLHFYFHEITPVVSDWMTLVDYVTTKRDQNILDVITAPDAVILAQAGKDRLATLVAVA